MNIPQFNTKKELFAWLVENKSALIATKKGAVKFADSIESPCILHDEQGEVIKANVPVSEDISELKIKVVINTTNLLDNHGDVHIPGLWKKSLRENKNLMHLQEHEMKFDHIISDRKDLKAYTETVTWKELGFNYYEGETEALIFESNVKQSRNAEMFREYKAGNVNNHSVGMNYVKILMAVNDKGWPEEFANWNKYIDQVVNRATAEEKGYFWPVLEAKIIEGSAVPAGSNWATPTLDNNMKSEPSEDTPEPGQPTQLTSEEIIKRIKQF